MFRVISLISKFTDKQRILAADPVAWLSGFGLFVADAFSRGKLTVYMVIVACAIDLICGIAVSVNRKKFTRSDLMRLTVEKLLVYGCVMLVFLCIDGWIADKTDFTLALSSSLIGVIITLTESVSFTASLLILFPRNLFLRLFQKMLKAELATKLGVDEGEVDSVLAQSRKSKQPRTRNGQFAAAKKQCGVVETLKRKKK
ncbi:MAG: hypothetical protein J6V72_00545 [Kiritimatiellae bacterium]|nr:hypothetical protein [Kiritimatiellia bacterium]